MLKLQSNRKFCLNKVNFFELINFEPKELGLEKDKNSELYIYNSKEYKILSWKIKPKIFINLIKSNEFIRVNLENKYISGIGTFSKLITVDIDAIIKGCSDDCLIERSIILGVHNDRKFLKFIPDYLVKNLIKETIELIAKRFDKRLSEKLRKISKTI